MTVTHPHLLYLGDSVDGVVVVGKLAVPPPPSTGEAVENPWGPPPPPRGEPGINLVVTFYIVILYFMHVRM